MQATLAPPVKGKMFKGLCVCYSVIVTTYFTVAISGYWAFGNQAMGTVLSNFMGDGKPLLPTWFLLMTNVFTLLQVSAVTVVRRIKLQKMISLATVTNLRLKQKNVAKGLFKALTYMHLETKDLGLLNAPKHLIHALETNSKIK